MAPSILATLDVEVTVTKDNTYGAAFIGMAVSSLYVLIGSMP